jgi:hypothetical protein
MLTTQRCVPAIIASHVGPRHVRCKFKTFTNISAKLQNKRGHLQIVATSEHWWEDEEEFDALTDALRKKVIVLITPGTGGNASTTQKTTEIDSLRSSLASLDFNAGFCSSEEIDYATKIWAGRDKPPLFLKMRRRATLDITERVSQFLEEALQQNWRLDLDAGLGLEEPPAEKVMVVCSQKVADSLLEACGGGSNSSLAETASSLPKVAVVTVEGTKAGDPADWKALSKRIEHLSQENIAKGQVLTF